MYGGGRTERVLQPNGDKTGYEAEMRAVLMITLAMGLASCGTVDGIGQDISAGARTVQGWF